MKSTIKRKSTLKGPSKYDSEYEPSLNDCEIHGGLSPHLSYAYNIM